MAMSNLLRFYGIAANAPADAWTLAILCRQRAVLGDEHAERITLGAGVLTELLQLFADLADAREAQRLAATTAALDEDDGDMVRAAQNLEVSAALEALDEDDGDD
jgi:S-methylmethionine-dependent homocysteine/selenocysteine methylase